MRIVINLDSLCKKNLKLNIDNIYLELIKFLILNKKGHEIYLVTSDKNLTQLKKLKDYFQNYLGKKYFFVYRRVNTRLFSIKQSLSNCKSFSNFITNLEPDIIININTENIETIENISQLNLTDHKDKVFLNQNHNIIYNSKDNSLDKDEISKNIILTLESLELQKDNIDLNLLKNKNKKKLLLVATDIKVKLQTYIDLNKFKEDLQKFYDVEILSNINKDTVIKLDNHDRLLYIIKSKDSYKDVIKLFKKYPGIVIMLDFNIQAAYCDNEDFLEALYRSHGYNALLDYHSQDKSLSDSYPCNLDIVESSLGIISYDSDFHTLLSNWYKIKKFNRYKYLDVNDYDISSYVNFIEEQYLANKYFNQDLNKISKSNIKQIFVDVSEFSRIDHKTGIQRLLRNILGYLLKNSIEGYRVEPVYGKVKQGYFYARNFTHDFLKIPKNQILDEKCISYNPGDVFIGLDFSIHYVLHNEEFLKEMQLHGVNVYFNINDFLPIKIPHCFPIGVKDLFVKWLSILSDMDGVICISNSVANDYYSWREKEYNDLRIDNFSKIKPFKVSWYHLGANINVSEKIDKLVLKEKEIIEIIKQKTTFLMVSTIEPRKGYEQTLFAFEKLWDANIDVNLVIVGKEGWKVSNLINKIKNHKELNKRLFWLKQISDSYLNEVYKNASCLVVASEGEGFGLPVIEAQLHGIPVIARDLMVFREVSSGATYYFKDSKSSDIIFSAIKDWLDLYKSNKIVSSSECKVLNWDDSARWLLKEIGVVNH